MPYFTLRPSGTLILIRTPCWWSIGSDPTHTSSLQSSGRPYLGGGGAYAKSFINYDQRIINALWSSGLQSLASDYTLDSFLGYVTGGLDVRLTKSISVGANTRYYAVLSSRENQSLNNAALSGYYPGYYGYGVYYSADADKQILGGTMSRAAFYSVTGEVTFTF